MDQGLGYFYDRAIHNLQESDQGALLLAKRRCELAYREYVRKLREADGGGELPLTRQQKKQVTGLIREIKPFLQGDDTQGLRSFLVSKAFLESSFKVRREVLERVMTTVSEEQRDTLAVLKESLKDPQTSLVNCLAIQLDYYPGLPPIFRQKTRFTV